MYTYIHNLFIRKRILCLLGRLQEVYLRRRIANYIHRYLVLMKETRNTNNFALFLSCPQAFCYFAKNIERNQYHCCMLLWPKQKKLLEKNFLLSYLIDFRCVCIVLRPKLRCRLSVTLLSRFSSNCHNLNREVVLMVF